MGDPDIGTIMRALGRIEGRLGGIEGKVDEHTGQLDTLTSAADKVQAVSDWREDHQARLYTLAGLPVTSAGVISAIVGYLLRHHP